MSTSVGKSWSLVGVGIFDSVLDLEHSSDRQKGKRKQETKGGR